MSEETALLVRQSVRQVPIEVLYVTRKSMIDGLYSRNSNSSANSTNLSDESYTSRSSNTTDNDNKENDDDDDDNDLTIKKMYIKKGNASELKYEHTPRARRKSIDLFRNAFFYPRHRGNGTVMNMYDENESRTYKLILYDVISGSVSSPLWVPLAHSYF